jgi:hypothetical protein
MATTRIVHPSHPAKPVPPQNESYLQYRGAHYLFLPELPPKKAARCVVCRGPGLATRAVSAATRRWTSIATRPGSSRRPSG